MDSDIRLSYSDECSSLLVLLQQPFLQKIIVHTDLRYLIGSHALVGQRIEVRVKGKTKYDEPVGVAGRPGLLRGFAYRSFGY
ncbi:MAG: hypothetical protein A2211_12710 [Rhodanobacter sp. RIFOXYA1_FULL_67_6]|nr:MAG: hypothetical protein A2211_12710 [Rhodanobacter sp. RIFOXYA1_FULL_67_6]